MKHPPRTIQVGVLVYPGCLRSSAVVPLDVLRIANAMTGYRPAKERLRFECRWLGARGEPTLAVDGLVFSLASLEAAKIDALIVPAVAHDAPHELPKVLDSLGPEQAAIAAYAAGGGLGSGANYGQRYANLPVRRLSSRSQNSCPDFGRSLPLSSQTS